MKIFYINRYITGYITKKENQITEEIWNSCNSNPTLHGALKSFALKSLKQRECGIYEAADKLLGYHMYNFSDQIYFLNAQPKVLRTRRFKDINEIRDLEEDSTDIFFKNIIDSYYPNRPNVSLILYYFSKVSSLKYVFFYFKLRNINYIPFLKLFMNVNIYNLLHIMYNKRVHFRNVITKLIFINN